MHLAKKANDRAATALQLLVLVANGHYGKKSLHAFSVCTACGDRMSNSFREILAFINTLFSTALVPVRLQGIIEPNCVTASRF